MNELELVNKVLGIVSNLVIAEKTLSRTNNIYKHGIMIERIKVYVSVIK
jgi:hypothetical protein